MKDKRLEVKLSVRGDGSLSRNSARSSTRSNRSNDSRSSGLPVSEIFAIDRFSSPYHRPFDIKYRQQYPAQSLQALNNYEEQQYQINNSAGSYLEPRYYIPQYHQPQIQTQFGPRYSQTLPYNDPRNQIYGTLPRNVQRHQEYANDPSALYTSPTRTAPRRVRISELQPIVHGYGTF